MRGRMVRGFAAACLSAALVISVAANTARGDERDERRAMRTISQSAGVNFKSHDGKRDYWRQKNYKSQRRWTRGHDGKRGYRQQKYFNSQHRWTRSKRFSYRQRGPRCRPVIRISYDGYGNRIKIGGTLCLNRYGERYILRGSRHIVY